jgi:hypothetical protein
LKIYLVFNMLVVPRAYIDWECFRRRLYRIRGGIGGY